MSSLKQPDFDKLNDRLIVPHSDGPFIGIRLPDAPSSEQTGQASQSEPSTAEDIAERLHNDVFSERAQE